MIQAGAVLGGIQNICGSAASNQHLAIGKQRGAVVIPARCHTIVNNYLLEQ